jgi:mannose-6-phosphate isomerase class I
MPELINRDPEKILGKYVWETFKIMPVLIKFTQALGNSFQLHIKTGIDHPHWKPKPESWYYFEKGYLSYGLKKGTDIRQYQQVCTLIDRKMHDLSMEVINHRLSLADARNAAAAYIKSLNPQQFINVHHVDPNTLIDLSPGGIHHSWEEDPDSANGNVLYEVQLDTADDVSTMRSFDQGKFKDDGTVRNLTISDYFEYIDKSEALNDIENARCRKNGDQLLSTRWYAMDEIELTKVRQVQIRDSFEHLFVREGHISVSCEYGKIDLSTGHSCFIPWGVRNYQIDPIIGKAVVIKTYICGGNQ